MKPIWINVRPQWKVSQTYFAPVGKQLVGMSRILTYSIDGTLVKSETKPTGIVIT